MQNFRNFALTNFVKTEFYLDICASACKHCVNMSEYRFSSVPFFSQRKDRKVDSVLLWENKVKKRTDSGI